MRVVSAELRQVFKAYTRQLRHAPAEDGAKGTEAVQYRRGFEKVELSAEARALASSSRATERTEEEPTSAEAAPEDGEAERVDDRNE